MSINKYYLVCSISLRQYKWTKPVILYWCFWEIDVWVGLCKCRELTKEQITGYRAYQPGLLDGREGGSPQNRDGSEGHKRVWRKLDGEGYRKAGISTPKTDWQHGRMAERLALTQLKYTAELGARILTSWCGNSRMWFTYQMEKRQKETLRVCVLWWWWGWVG